jgi:hypothetical protein
MKKLLPLLFFITTITIVLSSCKKDDTCRARVTVQNTLGIKQKNVWVIIDLAPGTPAGNFTDRVPVQLNTLQNGYVDVDFKLPAILTATAFDSTNTTFTLPGLGQAIIKLEPGENIPVVISVP